MDNITNTGALSAGRITESTVTMETQPTWSTQILGKPPTYGFRDFQVSKLNHGYVVTVGCSKFAIESNEKLIKVLTEYISNPSEKEKKWHETNEI